MARIKPFNGIRYNKAKINYSDVVTQPYDKISPELLDAYYNRSPYTTAKLIRNKDADPYQAAAENLNNWLNEKILVQDDKPAIYAYHQIYQVSGERKVRKGFVAAVGLEDFAKKVILPHEKTLAKPKTDRLNLLRATKTHFGQIFFLYSDPQKKIEALLANITAQEPDETAVDHFGDTHTLWKVDDEKIIKEVSRFMAEKQLLIADGHHRYETSCNFAKENGAALGEESPFGYTMATLVNMEDEGLTVLPTHRMLHGLPDFNEADFLEKARVYFDIASHHVLEHLLKAMQDKRAQGKICIGLYSGQPLFHELTLKDPAVMAKLSGTKSTAWQKLDVAVLHTLILENILGITKEKQEAQENINYIRTAHSAFEQVLNGKEQAVFLLNNTTVKQTYETVLAGDIMPQKSTDFYPKLLSGMVVYKLQ
ncbi:protein DUF1015 [Candidatus Termititenax dinenymphae]|uniref:Protein DUF1015 n=1 Tax=Candidatus Termititenax dinenymphae TaxID=2218523 RepID=A0A388TJN3_9BACT|nr:protein DUF1015 [Candidatus Termititenax dinenymphae]